jgi:TIR domain
MARSKYASIEQVARVLREALGKGATVEIDGLGSFRKTGKGYQFHSANLTRVFVAYASEDVEAADRIFKALAKAGFDPWMDGRKLLPGQNWGRAILNALETSDFVVCCFSQDSIHKRGGFQAEVRFALESARRMPLDEVFLVPVRLEECRVPAEVAREMQYVDLFPDWETGISRVVEAIRKQVRRPRAA